MAKKEEGVNWQSTRPLQVISCMACRLYERQRGTERDERVDKEQFLKEMKHYFPRWREYMPDWAVRSGQHIDDRLFNKGYAMNTGAYQHPTHTKNAYTTGRYWDVVCAHLDYPLETTPDHNTIQKLIDTVPPAIMAVIPKEIDMLVQALGDLKEYIDVVEHAIKKAQGEAHGVDYKTQALRRIMSCATALEIGEISKIEAAQGIQKMVMNGLKERTVWPWEWEPYPKDIEL